MFTRRAALPRRRRSAASLGATRPCASRSRSTAPSSEILDACVCGGADGAVGLLVTHDRRSVELVMGEAVVVETQPLQFRLSATPVDEAASG
ncbi:MAG: hypothetical protein ACK4WC_09460 [Rubrimonas sp.]